MDLKSVLKGYFDETPFPSELYPERIAAALQPRTQPKKMVETVEELPQKKVPAPAPKPAPAPIPTPKPSAEPVSLPVQKPAPMPSAEPVSLPVQKPAPAPIPQPQPEPEKSDELVINASTFIKIVRYHHLTGSEFLSLLGNSKISNRAYQEIETNPDLTVKRLIEILEESALTPADYEKLTIAIQRNAKLKEEAKAKFSVIEEVTPFQAYASDTTFPQDTSDSAPPQYSSDTTFYTLDASSFGITESSAPAPEPVISPMQMEEIVPNPVISPMQMEEIAPEPVLSPLQAEKAAPEPTVPTPQPPIPEVEREPYKPVGVPMPMLFEDEDGDELEDREAENLKLDGHGNPKTNRGKFITCSVFAVLLVALSFGIRWYFTGSWLPSSEIQAAEEPQLDEKGIFEALSILPAPNAAAFAQNRTYTAGGIGEESALLSSVTMGNRFLYLTDNTLYIFEKLGGQLEQLDARQYGEGIELLGLLKLNSGIAVVTSYEGNAYSFTYTIPPENEGESETVVNGTVLRPETVIELLDGEKPEDRSGVRLIGFSGSLAALWTEGDRITAVTGESLPEGAAGQDPYSFMPYLYTPFAEGKILCQAENAIVPDNMQYSAFATVFSVDVSGGAYSTYTVAGGSGQLVSRSGNDLFIGQSGLLARYDISGGVTEKGHCALSGGFGEFSAVGVYGGEIRVTASDNGSAVLLVLDGELNELSQVNNLGNGEALVATCFYGNETYIITESGILYGISGSNEPLTATSVTVTHDRIYKWSDSIGVMIDPMGDVDKRTGLSVTAVSLDGSLSVLSTLEISSRTVAEQALDEYLSSPAETDTATLGASFEDGVLVVPVVYFDGVSEVERFVICSLTEQGNLSLIGSICEYDRQSSLLFASVGGGNVTAVTGDRLITAKADDGSIIGYFNSKAPGGTYSYSG